MPAKLDLEKARLATVIVWNYKPIILIWCYCLFQRSIEEVGRKMSAASGEWIYLRNTYGSQEQQLKVTILFTTRFLTFRFVSLNFFILSKIFHIASKCIDPDLKFNFFDFFSIELIFLTLGYEVKLFCCSQFTQYCQNGAQSDVIFWTNVTFTVFSLSLIEGIWADWRLWPRKQKTAKSKR